MIKCLRRILLRQKRELSLLVGNGKFQSLCKKFHENHGKCVLSEHQGVIFSANIDGKNGLLSGLKSDVFLQKSKEIKLITELIKYLKMENNFLIHVNEWRQMNQTGRFVEARQFYFDELFEEVVENFENR